MSNLWGPLGGAVTSLPVRWVEQDVPHRRWGCAASAAEPLVAMLVGLANDEVRWVKSSHRSEAPLVFSVPDTRFDGSDSGVHFHPNAAGVFLDAYYCRDPENSGNPTVALPESSVTGVVVRLATLTGTPTIQTGMLLLARRDVKFGRNALWHLRPEIQERLSGQRREVLSYGRKGSLSIADW